MFLYIKDYFQKRIFHILLIIFCGLLMFNSIMMLIDLKNYEVVSSAEYYNVVKEDGKTKIELYRHPSVYVEYKYASMPNKFTWANGQLFQRNCRIEKYTLEYKVYKNFLKDQIEGNLVDSFTVEYPHDNGVIVKEYETDKIYAVEANVVDYKIKFKPRVYLPHIFVIVGSLFFIVPSVVMLYKIRKEENGK